MSRFTRHVLSCTLCLIASAVCAVALVAATEPAHAETRVMLHFDAPAGGWKYQDGTAINPGDIDKYKFYRTSTSGVYTDPALGAVAASTPYTLQAIFSNYYFRFTAVDRWGRESLPSVEQFVFPGMTCTSCAPATTLGAGVLNVEVLQ